MSYFSIVSDASCDLNAALRSRFEIDALIYSQILFPDGHSETVDTDWGNITPDAYFGSMVDKKLRYQSSSPGPENAKRVFRAELEKGNDVLCVTLSSGMSAIYEHCLIAKEELASEFPDRTICILDSKRYSTASGLLCILASVIDNSFHNQCTCNPDQNICRMETGKRILKCQFEIGKCVHQSHPGQIPVHMTVEPCDLIHHIEHDHIRDVENDQFFDIDLHRSWPLSFCLTFSLCICFAFSMF